MVFSKNANELTNLIEQTEKIGIEEFNSFINGINRDIDATKNAIILDNNNDLAEGSVDKLKVIKRIMYGKNSIKMLKYKLLKLEHFNSS